MFDGSPHPRQAKASSIEKADQVERRLLHSGDRGVILGINSAQIVSSSRSVSFTPLNMSVSAAQADDPWLQHRADRGQHFKEH